MLKSVIGKLAYMAPVTVKMDSTRESLTKKIAFLPKHGGEVDPPSNKWNNFDEEITVDSMIDGFNIIATV